MKHKEKILKQRKFYLLLPALVLPFITLLFWSLGGGKGATVQAMPLPEGLNSRLPDAQFERELEEDLWDKFTLYERAARDSAEHETARENDPYFDLTTFEAGVDKSTEGESKLIGTFKRRDRLVDPNEAKVNSKLEELYHEISRVSNSDSDEQNDPEQMSSSDPAFTEDVSRLESMMEQIYSEQTDGPKGIQDQDPEMAEINSVLDKLMDIQHPERVRNRVDDEKTASKPKVFEVRTTNPHQLNNGNGTSMHQVTDSTLSVVTVNNSFYNMDDLPPLVITAPNTIRAAIHETQQIISGATIRLRLLQEITINSVIIPKDHFVFGSCSINGERLMIEITSILQDQTLIPVSLSVFDLSGLEGIYVPGAMSRDAAKQASDDALQGVQLMSMDQSVGAQAASAGIEATKGLLSRKAKLIRVTVKAGHQVVLRNKTDQ